jgi:predicted Rossmann fold flavoprotein
MKKLGASDSGYLLAKSLKHKITPILPSLVQLKSSNKNLDIITGVKIEGDIKLNNKKLQYGDFLFTKYGLSGSAILDISRQISFKVLEKKEISLTIDLLPQMDKNILINILSKELKKNPNKDLILWLNGLINKKLAKYIILNSKIPTNIKYIKFLSPTHIKKVVDMIKNLPFIIIDTQGFESCEVCAGGVDTKDINSKTMESKIQKGLYFIGEVLDVDGDCGGYNLHWAWGSGFLATQAIIQSVK